MLKCYQVASCNVEFGLNQSGNLFFSDMFEDKLLSIVASQFTRDDTVDESVEPSSCDQVADPAPAVEMHGAALLHAETMIWGAHWEDDPFWRAQKMIRVAPSLRALAESALRKMVAGDDCRGTFCLRRLSGAMETDCKQFKYSVHW